MKRKVAAKPKKARKKPFPIVAIGASAGGVEAITELVKHLPNDTGMGFIYIQHLDPSHKSLLTEIIGRATKMKVQTAEHLMPIKPDNIYIIPHNKDLYALNGVLTLNNRQPKPAVNMPIDKFFKSLADVHKQGAIGVVLSGNANDGTSGLKEIKNNGGLTFAQDGSAKFESMPKAAIAEGCVDMILSPKEIAQELGRISRNTDVMKQVLLEADEQEGTDIDDNELDEIIELMRKSVSVDFRNYKRNTIRRRIVRRMLLYKLPTLGDYLKYLKEHTSEINTLFQDMLINVTAFFRDPDTLEYLKKSVLPKILKGKTQTDAIRIWVQACSTGEEAYSIAIIINEILSEKGLVVPIQIFASDLSEHAIAKARIGLYSKGDVDNVSPKRLQKFFTKIDGSYRINKIIRDSCVFAPHNVFSDPPFSRVDLISCCNLLIYLEPVLQKKILATFHYSLKPEGHLILGKSETLGTSGALFEQLDKKFKVFTRKNDSRNKVKFEMQFQLPEPVKKGVIKRSGFQLKNDFRESNYEKAVEEILLSKYVAASVVVSKELEILQFHGPVRSFIDIAQGKATLNLLKLVSPHLVFDLRNIIHKAVKSGKTEKKSDIETSHNGKSASISIEVIPVGKGNDEKTFLIIFEKSPAETSEEQRKTTSSKDQLVKKLQRELETTKEDIRSILEEQEASNEELQSANEEIVSSNEELQSINEELETSKEEVESSNEELMTINSELQVRNEQLAEAQEYSDSVSETIREAVLVLDRDFRVRSANKAFYRIFKTKEEETEGMLIYELGRRQWDILELRQLLEQLISTRLPINGFEVQHDFPVIGEKTMLLHAQTITQKVVQKQIIILAIEDITEHRIAQRIAEERELWFRNMSNNAPCMIWMTGKDKARNFFNKTWFEFTGSNEKDGASWIEYIHNDDISNYRETFEKGFSAKNQLSVEYRLKRADGQFRWMLDVAKPYYADNGNFLGYIGTSSELHDKKIMVEELDRQVKQRTEELDVMNTELQRSNAELQQFAYVASHDLQEPLRKILTYIDRLNHLNEEFSGTSSGYLEKITDSARRMTKLIDALLDFSTISFTEKKFTQVDLNQVLKEVLANFEVALAEKNASIKVGKDLPVISAEQVQIGQLFQNLISNALKFSKEDIAPKISIEQRMLTPQEIKRIDSFEHGTAYLELKFADNGIGFDPEFTEQIFVIFQRLNEKKRYPGTGIGLALCKKIISNHHGHIYAESSDKGSTFYVILPVNQIRPYGK